MTKAELELRNGHLASEVEQLRRQVADLESSGRDARLLYVLIEFAETARPVDPWHPRTDRIDGELTSLSSCLFFLAGEQVSRHAVRCIGRKVDDIIRHMARCGYEWPSLDVSEFDAIVADTVALEHGLAHKRLSERAKPTS